MLMEGQWLVPVLHGEPYLDKPPLLYWLVMGSYLAFGVHDWAARLIPAAAGVLAVLVTFLWGRRTLGPRAGLCGALCLCLMAGFIYRMRMLGMDGLLCLWVTAGLAAAHLAVDGGRLRRGWWLAAALACGLGLLTKGPVALVLVAVPVAAYVRLEPRAARVSLGWWALFAAIAVGLAAPWYVAVQLREPSFAQAFFWTHHVERFLAPFDHNKPAWFYVPVLALTLLPWTLLLPGFVLFLGRRPLRQAIRRPMALGFPLLAGLGCVAFFSLSGCKRPGYVLPAIPALALALGCYIDRWVPARLGWSGLWTLRCRAAHQLTVALLAASLALVVVACGKGLVRPSTAVPMGLAVLLGLGLLSGRRRLSWAVLGATCFAVLLLAVLQLLPSYNRQFALRGLRREHELGVIDRLPIVCYPQRWDSVSFYLPHARVRAFGRDQHDALIAELQSRPETLVVVHSGKACRELAQALPPSLELVVRGREGALIAAWVRRSREAPPPCLVADLWGTFPTCPSEAR
jgi:dolichol-phosphate mannosyltransferase